MVGDLVPSDEPIGDEGIIRVIERRKICDFWLTAIRVYPLGQELVDST
jgi:hypothetical protein